jgi:hypothetical protein
MTKIDGVWLGTVILTYDVCKDNANWSLDDIYFSQQDIVGASKDIIGEDIPNALVSQHACAYSNSQNKNCMYLVARNKERRASYSGEFSGKTERPDFSETKDNIVKTKHGDVEINELLNFIDNVYSPRMKKLLEEYFTKYDLGSVYDFIREYEGHNFIAIEKAGAQATEMKTYKELGSAARVCVKDFADEIKTCMPRYEKSDISGWINQGQRTVEYIWSQLRKKSKEDLPSSMSVFFERVRTLSDKEKKYELRISVEAQDSKCVKDENSSADEKYYRHARLLDIEKKPGLDYYIGGSLPGELVVSNKTAEELRTEIHSSKMKKIQICKVLSEDEVRKKTAYEVYQFMIEAVYELEPYYDAAVAEENSAEWWPGLEEYNPGISAEQYERILSDETKVKDEHLDTILCLYSMGGSGTCKQIAEQYGNVPEHYNSNARTIATIVQQETGCALIQREDGRDAYWPVLFVGREAGKQETGVFIWKLRAPLKDAIKSMIKKGIIDMENSGYKHIGKGLVKTGPLKRLKNKTCRSYDLNMILYGPPGTGKTYNTAIYAVAICDGKSIEELSDYGAVMERYKELKKEGRIAFTTFHQSYGYEEFIEGIKPKMDGESKDIEYTIKDGVFKAFCDKAGQKKAKTEKVKVREGARIWSVILGGNESPELKQQCFAEGTIRIGWSGEPDIITDETEGINDKERRILLNFQDEMEIGDIVVSRASTTSVDAIGIVSGNYEIDRDKKYPRCRKVDWICKSVEIEVIQLNGGIQLDRKSVYALSRMNANDLLSLIPDDTSADIEIEDETKPYVFIIDEINRGNISKIFGELITLIEPTKRKSADEAMEVTLPYSNKPFGVPNNVYIIGTMNTADRSIALMDTALRRRFQFIEMMPKAQVLRDLHADKVHQGDIVLDVAAMLETINERIEYLYDREHTIGHAFFTGLKDDPTVGKLADIFKKSVIPLLQEYFYEDYSKIMLILGDNGKEKDEQKFILAKEIKPNLIFRGDTSDIDIPDYSYEIQEKAFDDIISYVQIKG